MLSWMIYAKLCSTKNYHINLKSGRVKGKLRKNKSLTMRHVCNGNLKRKYSIALYGELALEEALDLT